MIHLRVELPSFYDVHASRFFQPFSLPPPPSPLLPRQCSFPIVWGLLDALRFCASLNVGAGCQKWRPLDTSGSQPLFNDAVV